MPAGTLKQGAIAGVALAGDLCQPDFDRRRQRLGYPPAHVDRGGGVQQPSFGPRSHHLQAMVLVADGQARLPVGDL